MRKRNARNKRLRRNGKKRRRKNVSAGKKPRRNVWPRNAARRNKPLATRWPEPLVWETPRVTAKATLKAEPVTKGSPFGNSDHGANEGVGGYGSFNLNGRSIGAGGLPRPAYTIQEEGRIVINITVDPKGNVIFAEVGRGTNIDNASMRKKRFGRGSKGEVQQYQRR